MRDVRELCEDVSRYKLETTVTRVYRAADIPALKSANARDRKRLKKGGLESYEADGLKLDVRFREDTIRRLEKHKGNSALEIRRTEMVKPGEGLPALSEHIRAHWTVDEILFFRGFTRGGIVTPSNGAGAYRMSGYEAETMQGQNNLVRLFDGFHAEIWAAVGARLCLSPETKEGRAFTLNSGDIIDAQRDKTLDEFMRELPLTITRAILEGINATKAAADKAAREAERGANAAERARDEMERWRKYGPQLDGKNGGDNVTKPVRDAFCKVWTDYKKASLDEFAADSRERGRGQKRTFGECIADRGKEAVYKGRALRDLLEDARRKYEGPEQTFKRIFEAARKADSRRNATE